MFIVTDLVSLKEFWPKQLFNFVGGGKFDLMFGRGIYFYSVIWSFANYKVYFVCCNLT